MSEDGKTFKAIAGDSDLEYDDEDDEEEDVPQSSTPSKHKPRSMKTMKTSKFRGETSPQSSSPQQCLSCVLIGRLLTHFLITWALSLGVTLISMTHANPWKAQIWTNGRAQTLGRFATEEEAALAYDAAARVHHRENAVLNFPDGTEYVAGVGLTMGGLPLAPRGSKEPEAKEENQEEEEGDIVLPPKKWLSPKGTTKPGPTFSFETKKSPDVNAASGKYLIHNKSCSV